MTRYGPTTLLVLTTALAPSIALAHPDVDEGRRFFEEAQFLEALDAFARAEAADDLVLDDLVELYETRALVHLAMQNEDPMREDLRRLVVVAPDHVLDRRAPPDVRRTFAEVRAESPGPVRLRVRPQATATGVTVEAEAENDPLGVVRAVRVHGRVGEGSWDSATDAPLLVPLTEQGVVEYWAEAVGPGGVALASSGSAEDPLRFAGEAASAEDDGGEDGGGDDGPVIGAVLGVVGALLVGGAVAVVLVFTLDDGSDQPTVVQPFTVRF